jgi:hypothetical protein
MTQIITKVLNGMNTREINHQEPVPLFLCLKQNEKNPNVGTVNKVRMCIQYCHIYLQTLVGKP